MNGIVISGVTCAPMHALPAQTLALPIRDRAWHAVEKLRAAAAVAAKPAHVHAARAHQRFPVYHRIIPHASDA